jgi:hypothetical protein
MSNIRRFSQSIESMDIDYRQLFADFQVIRWFHSSDEPEERK